MTVHHRRRFVVLGVLLVVLANAVALLGVLADDEPTPLSVGTTELRWAGDTAAISVPVRNDSDDAVELLSASVPGLPAATLRRPTSELYVSERDAWRPVAASKLGPGDSELLDIAMSARCPNAPTVRTLEVRMRVDGREVTQTLTLPKVLPGRCS
jgi:hypothetical protein